MDKLPLVAPITISLGGTIVSIGLLHLCYVVAITLLHICLALATRKDAIRMNSLNGRGTFLLGENIWSLSVLLFGLLGICAYWLIHHSTLRPSRVTTPATGG